MFVIHKRSRTPTGKSYMGPTWDAAGIRELYRPTYASREEAERLADRLAKHNPVGFAVAPTEDGAQ